MIVLVTGGSGSGKSAYAEKRAVELSDGMNLIYLATMWNDPDDPETAARIERHRAMRSGKGFATVEQPSHIDRAEVHPNDTVLLEDLPNLLANELYREGRNDLTAIAAELNILASRCANLVVVTGMIDCDGNEYDLFTQNYIYSLSALNRTLARHADEVTEVVAGIPLRVK